MENTSLTTKRKRRRTRRSLDEIRNRLRRKLDDYNPGKNSLHNTKCIESKNKENCLVTKDRLTLKPMFSNAVTSATITRPVLEEIKQIQSLNLVDVVKGNVNNAKRPSEQDNFISKLNSSVEDIKERSLNSNESFYNSTSLVKSDRNSPSGENRCKNDGAESPGSFLLFSPNGSIDESTKQSKTVNETAMSSTSSSSETSQDNLNKRYKELMDAIPSGISHLVSPDKRDNGINITVSKLRELYMEGFQADYEPNFIKHNNANVSSVHEPFQFRMEKIVENPQDYIRLEYDRRQDNMPVHVTLSESSSRPVNSGSNASSPLSPCLTVPDFDIVVPYDTPDYNYYPHCLK